MGRTRQWWASLGTVAFGGLLFGAVAAFATRPIKRAGEDDLALDKSERMGASEVSETRLAARPHQSPSRPEWIDEPRDPFGQRLANGLVMTGATRHRLILFTFDDGPNRDTTPKLLDYLDAEGIRAVFFFTASRLVGQSRRKSEQRELAREVIRRGHMVGNHTVDHLSFLSLNNEEIETQIVGAERIFQASLGHRPFLIRPPGGNRTPRIDKLIASFGYTQVLWNLGAGDTQVDSPEDTFRTWLAVQERRERDFGERGGIVLLHDLQEHSVEAFPRIVAELWKRNCELLETGEELYDVVDDPTFFFAPRRPGHGASDEAPPASLPPAVLAERQARLRVETEQRCVD